MKTPQILLIMLSLCISNVTQAQKNESTKKDSTEAKTEVKSDNFMDLAAGTLTQIFGEDLDGNSTGNSLSFLEFIEKMDLPKEQKEEYKNWYYIQTKDLTQKQKDSLGNALKEKMIEAQKTQSKNKKNR
ncbi:hypothetical protein ACOKFD_00620 [Flagellimonas sp. S174]|uniref:hypothetical protein n=1 Tax=Flagellimonas sp. S174 TaxID=3410790 RepID=UPI003BF46CB2